MKDENRIEMVFWPNMNGHKFNVFPLWKEVEIS